MTEILAMHPSAVKTDISRYYPTIYTHAIAWALYGKAKAKSNLYDKAFNAQFGCRLDKHIRDCQGKQSVGLPIGPDTSRIVGEIIGVALERELHKKIEELNLRALRYVDDLTIGFSSSESADAIVSKMQTAFAHFELDMNIEKTKVLGIGESLAPEWIIPLRKPYSRLKAITSNEIEEFFKTALYLAQENQKDSVLKYALKRSRSFIFDKVSWIYYQNWILRVTRKHPECLPSLAQILIEKRNLGHSIDRKIVQKFIIDMIEINQNLHNHFETSWSLFLAKGLSIPLDCQILESIAGMNSSTCSLICFDLSQRGLSNGKVNTKKWEAIYEPNGLKDERWLFVYEATIKGWMTDKAGFVSKDPFFGPMKQKKISFYNENRNTLRTKTERKIETIQNLKSKFIFEHIDEYF